MDEAAFRDEFFDYVDDLENERLPKRYIRDAENPIEFYDESEFRRRYRFNKYITVEILFPLVAEQLQKPNNRGLPFPSMQQLLICLRYYATGSFQVVCGDLRGASQQSVSNIIKRCTILITEKCRDYIKFPVDQAGQRVNINKFYQYAGFPTVSGSIDCTHIRISSPGGENAEVFRNRKGYFSLNVQVVTGPSMEMLDIVVRHPGSNHDSVIFDRSSVRVRFERHEVTGILIGDSGYPCRTYLLTPVLLPGSPQEHRYNVIERVFGVWKRLFPCLQKGLTKLDTSVATICACAVLHNIHTQYNVGECNEQCVEEVFEQPHIANNIIGLTVRQQFILRHF